MVNCGRDLNYFTFLVQVQARQQTVQNFPLSKTGLKVEASCTDVTGFVTRWVGRCQWRS